MLPRFCTPAQRVSEARIHTSLAVSLPLLPAGSASHSISHCRVALLMPLSRCDALKVARMHAVARLQARPKVRDCPRHASAPPRDPRRALCRSSAHSSVHSPLPAVPMLWERRQPGVCVWGAAPRHPPPEGNGGWLWTAGGTCAAAGLPRCRCPCALCYALRLACVAGCVR